MFYVVLTAVVKSCPTLANCTQVVSALHLMLQKWSDENVWADMDVPEGNVVLKLVTLGKLCGAVIGEGGKTIKDMIESTGCDIRVQVRSASFNLHVMYTQKDTVAVRLF